MMSNRLQNKVSIITGAGTGFGEEIARRFVAEGAKVVLVDINEKNGARVAADLPEGTSVFVQGDVSRGEDWEKFVEVTLSSFGQIDIVVNNAGVVNTSISSIELPEAEFDRLMRINTKSVFHSAKHVVPAFRQSGKGGVFLTISSTNAVQPRANMVWYAASKAAVSAATKGLALELARENIRCNAICPCAGDTSMLPLVMGNQDTTDTREVLLKGIPMRRFATPPDIANAAVFLASDEASFVTGVEFPVDGGRLVA